MTAEPVFDMTMTSIDEAPNLLRGFETFGRAGVPFVVRGCRIADLSAETFIERMEGSGATVFGYRACDETVGNIRLGDAVKDWKRETLAANIVDAPAPELIAPHEVDADLARYGIHAGSLMVVLTNRLTYTTFHRDPPSGGGGWMWLATGRKLWHFIEPDDRAPLTDGEIESLRDVTADELLRAGERTLRQAWIGGGDFLWFPPSWVHCVRTDTRAIGLGGYASPSSGSEQAY